MKELSIEEKAKAYDEAIERAKEINREHSKKGFKPSDDVLYIFPGLKNNGDEKVSAIEGFETEFERQVSYLIASAINREHEYNEGYVKWTANALLNYAKHELEAQGEQKPAEEYNITGIGSKNAQGKLGEMIKKLKPVNDVLEQTHTDKIEPKFKVGDWVMLDRPVLITKVEDMPYNIHEYWTSDGTWFGDTTKAKLWTIQDAKDGDVLYESSTNTILMFKSQTCGWIKVYCDLWTNKINLPMPDSADYGRVSEMDLKPATKEQRDLLFKKMKEAGYEWDNEKKELKKVEQKHTEWSDTDYVMQRAALEILMASPKTVAFTILKESVIVWLKSLKDRVQPQPKQDSTDRFFEGFKKGEQSVLENYGKYGLCKLTKWSEEDKKRIDQICEDLRCGMINFNANRNVKGLHFEETIESNIAWLKELAERVALQPKQE